MSSDRAVTSLFPKTREFTGYRDALAKKPLRVLTTRRARLLETGSIVLKAFSHGDELLPYPGAAPGPIRIERLRPGAECAIRGSDRRFHRPEWRRIGRGRARGTRGGRCCAAVTQRVRRDGEPIEEIAIAFEKLWIDSRSSGTRRSQGPTEVRG